MVLHCVHASHALLLASTPGTRCAQRDGKLWLLSSFLAKRNAWMNNELWGQHGLAFGEGPLHRDHVCFRVMNGDTGESGGCNLPLIDKVEFAPMHPPKEGKHETVAVPTYTSWNG